MFIGLDVHKATISVAVAQSERGGEVRHWGTIPHRPDHVRKLVEKLGAGRSRLYFCYEAGPCGYGLQRQLVELGHDEIHADAVSEQFAKLQRQKTRRTSRWVMEG
ncbi:hypothetical protein [Antarcticimicrobium sediminis]|uniref:hypothetical protein n=1 Tax=Antarcticimicrobium sediminis TaxID=2546227 RepID=UPI0019CF97DA|nr:hypothetical protein [Antarcticimicrobium sediminis]